VLEANQAAGIRLFWRWLGPHVSTWEGDVVNGAAKKQATDDPSALAQRLSNIEARLEAIEAELDTGPAADELAPHRAWHLWWFALLAILIAGLGFYLFELDRHPELVRQHAAAIVNALCIVHHGLPIQNPCVW